MQPRLSSASCVLAIESSTDALSLAVRSGGLTSTQRVDPDAKHAAQLLPLLRTLLESRELNLRDVDAIAAGVGPGSFTGVRTAISCAQGLALGAGKPAVGVPSLAALAWQARNLGAAGRIVTLLDARMGEMYGAVYEFSESILHTVMQPCIMSVEKLIQWKEFNVSACAGNALRVHAGAEQALRRCGVEAFFDVMPRAEAIAELAMQFQYAPLEPLYVRNQVALTIAQRQESSHAV
jgi:tRNA threonylcarbamoyladenosine biosynthesis protein TsaB